MIFIAAIILSSSSLEKVDGKSVSLPCKQIVSPMFPEFEINLINQFTKKRLEFVNGSFFFRAKSSRTIWRK